MTTQKKPAVNVVALRLVLIIYGMAYVLMLAGCGTTLGPSGSDYGGGAAPEVEPPVVSASIPAQIVGSWIHSGSGGAWGYTFWSDGTYEHVFKTEQDLLGCMLRIELYETGSAQVEPTTIILYASNGSKTTRYSCDSSKDSDENLAGTSSQLQWQTSGGRLYLDDMAFRPFQP
jgi:hypothetical protein